jgi:glucose dehydrogenase
MPATLGGMNWGGVALDRKRPDDHNQSHLAIAAKLVPRARVDAMPEARSSVTGAYPMNGTPYGVIRSPFFSNGAPCSPPP